MKYSIGDKVRYDSGDWRFYGTVSAMFENSICPCYRLSVEQMEKKTCSFAITQFEFELELYNAEVDGVDEDKWRLVQFEKAPEPVTVAEQKLVAITEPVPEKRQRKNRETKPEIVETLQEPAQETAKPKIRKEWEKNFELFRKGQKSYAVYNWVTNNRKHYKAGTMPVEKYEKLKSIKFPFEVTRKQDEKKQGTETSKRKKGDEWEINFESYKKGERNDVISSWIADNRKEFKTGKLTEERYEKLLGINFLFDFWQQKDDGWDKQFEAWKMGERRSKAAQQWKQRSLKQYSEDKLSVDKILKLREVGILN